MRKFNFNIRENEEVTKLVAKQNNFLVKTDKNSYWAKTVIVASGKKSRELGVSGEKEFKNKGLVYCATCDAPLFSEDDVAVIGGGNSALDATLQLMKIANYVYIINIADYLTGDEIMQKKIKKSKKVSILNNSQVIEILGDNFVNAIKIEKDKKEETLAVQGIFVEIGLIPNSDFAVDLNKTKSGEIKVNNKNETNIPGIFAAGDVTDVFEKQIIIAVGEGAKATLSVFRYLSSRK